MSRAGAAVALCCDDCAREFDVRQAVTVCPSCGGLLEVRYDLDAVAGGLPGRAAARRDLGMWRWRELLPVVPEDEAVSLGEGDSPLLAVPRLAAALGLRELHVKNDAFMPTGSFKDRGFSLALTVARSLGLRSGFTYSSGNAGASFAAYAARAGLAATVFVEESANEAKVASIALHGARVYRLQYDSSADIFAVLDTLGRAGHYSFTNFINPVRHEAMKVYAYEICEQLRWSVPDVIVHPVGTGGGLYGAWKGFRELRDLGLIDRVPRMVGVQPTACAPLVDAITGGRECARTVGDPSATMAQSIAGDALIHGGRRLLRAIRESGGTAVAVSEDQLADAMRVLGRHAISAEPSAAASVAALLDARAAGWLGADESVVAVVTGSALKQPSALTKVAPLPVGTVRADADEWRAVLDDMAVSR